jgi:hypothetical protein
VPVALAVEAVAVIRTLPCRLTRAELASPEALVRTVWHDGVCIAGAAALRGNRPGGVRCVSVARRGWGSDDEGKRGKEYGDASPTAIQRVLP